MDVLTSTDCEMFCSYEMIKQAKTNRVALTVKPDELRSKTKVATYAATASKSRNMLVWVIDCMPNFDSSPGHIINMFTQHLGALRQPKTKESFGHRTLCLNSGNYSQYMVIQPREGMVWL